MVVAEATGCLGLLGVPAVSLGLTLPCLGAERMQQFALANLTQPLSFWHLHSTDLIQSPIYSAATVPLHVRHDKMHEHMVLMAAVIGCLMLPDFS